jgi:hypothetical protein
LSGGKFRIALHRPPAILRDEARVVGDPDAEQDAERIGHDLERASLRTATARFEQLASEVPAGELTWDAWGASNGCIYFGTFPNAMFGE